MATMSTAQHTSNNPDKKENIKRGGDPAAAEKAKLGSIYEQAAVKKAADIKSLKLPPKK